MLKYLSFYGKASRQQYWGVGAIGVISFVFLSPVYFVLGSLLEWGIVSVFPELNSLWGVEMERKFGFVTIHAFGILSAFLFLLASVRRCRDASINLWWMLLWLVPFVNIVFVITLGCLISSDT